MKARFVAVVAMATLALFVITSCNGGGGASGIFSNLPKGNYNAVMGLNPAAKYESGVFKDLTLKIKSLNDQAYSWRKTTFDMGLSQPKMNTSKIEVASTDSSENLSYMAGKFDKYKLEDYYEKKVGWDDWSSRERRGKEYYQGKVGGNDQAVFLDNSGLLSGSVRTVENYIDMMTERERRLIDDEDFKEARQLADFGATEYALFWGKLGFQDSMANVNVDDLEENDAIIFKAVKNIKAIGYSANWSDRLRMTMKVLSKDEKTIKALYELIKKDDKAVYEKNGASLLKQFLGGNVTIKDIDVLVDNTKVSLNGKVLVIETNLSFADIEDLIE